MLCVKGGSWKWKVQIKTFTKWSNLCRWPRRCDNRFSHSLSLTCNAPHCEYMDGLGCTWTQYIVIINISYIVYIPVVWCHIKIEITLNIFWDLRSQQSSSTPHIPPGECHLIQLTEKWSQTYFLNSSLRRGRIHFSKLPLCHTWQATAAFSVFITVTLALKDNLWYDQKV